MHSINFTCPRVLQGLMQLVTRSRWCGPALARWREPLQQHVVPALLLLWQAAPVLLQEAADDGLLEAVLRSMDSGKSSGEPRMHVVSLQHDVSMRVQLVLCRICLRQPAHGLCYWHLASLRLGLANGLANG